MNFITSTKKIYKYLQKDTWDSWLVSLVLIIVLIKFILFPLLSLMTGSPLPLVVVESCSMYHQSSFTDWFGKSSSWYQSRNITFEEFNSFPFKSGLNKGDIILVWGYSKPKLGDVIIFNAGTTNPIIHRVISLNPIATKGDNNPDQLPVEKTISSSAVIGKSVLRIPLLGWIKLIFFEPFKPAEQRGFCSGQ